VGSAEPAVLDAIRDEVLRQLGELKSESEIVYHELVLPGWGSSDRHGFPRTLYGYVMVSFAFIDLLSLYRYGDGPSQTERMRTLLIDYLDASEDAAAVAVKLWRHTLMHTGNPQPLIERSSGKRYNWLLQWRDHLPRDEHMEFQHASQDEEVLNVGLLYLVEDLLAGAERLFAEAGGSEELRQRALRMHAVISAPSM
jgi:hypothetical protein